MLIGYVRVSTAEQNAARQEVLMQELGAEKVFVDKASGKNVNRPQLNEMLAFARQGDTIVVGEHQPLCPEHKRSAGSDGKADGQRRRVH